MNITREFSLTLTPNQTPTDNERQLLKDTARDCNVRFQTNAAGQFRIVSGNPLRLYRFMRVLRRQV